MTARPGQHITVTVTDQHWRDARVCLATIAAAVAWTYAVAATVAPDIVYVKVKAPVAKIDPDLERVLRAGCKLPDLDGAFTAYARLDGKIICWRFR